MKALVTGATGFVGGAVVRALVNTGVDVRVLARAGADLQNIQNLTVKTVLHSPSETPLTQNS